MVSPIPIDWREFHERERATPAVVDSRRRMRLALYGFLALLGIVFGRVVQLEVSQGPAFRGEAARPLVRTRELPAPRGRILARNGTVLACDKQVMALAVYYRYLEEPPDGQWLRRTARARLSKADRKNPERAAEEERRVQWERADLARRLARLCGLSDDEWRRRARQIQDRVERIAASVNRRKEEADRGAAASPAEPAPDAALPSLWDRLCAAVEETLEASIDPSLPERIVVAEELDYHAIAEDLPLDVAAEVEANPARYPGVKVVQRHRRVYPAAALAAHVLGYLGAPGEDDAQTASAGDATAEPDRVGRAGAFGPP